MDRLGRERLTQCQVSVLGQNCCFWKVITTEVEIANRTVGNCHMQWRKCIGCISLACNPAGQCRSTQQRGLIPRVLAQLFIDIAALTSKVITLHMTYVEIYNEAIFDLLDESSKGVTIVDCTEGVMLQGAAVVRLLDEKQAIDTFCRGETARAKRGHALNGASSRSHAVCTVHIAIKNDPGDPQALHHLLTQHLPG